MTKLYYNFGKEFTNTPGGRIKRDGDSSAEEFIDHIIPVMNKSIKLGLGLVIDLRNLYGLPIAFIDQYTYYMIIRYGYDIVNSIEYIDDKQSDHYKKIKLCLNDYKSIIDNRKCIHFNIKDTYSQNSYSNIPSNDFISSIQKAIYKKENILIIDDENTTAFDYNTFNGIYTIINKLFDTNDLMMHVYIQFKNKEYENLYYILKYNM